ncbi:conserved hypothetical protein [Methylocella silvestris BL2]|uniref:Uncharacterized protein n=1 Tax=Methylocella silvestris (strain DSM 15510 / CIP 108128 / LMG 27833 / NCIMB 13906 / BL2) TaxID=395965 RepID=B8ER14_METSB|nr:DUF6111 family protein [Methylocella silvestris]ACK49759.1 conserved hypothetical protein [Methylocella silvestris BL2]
MWRVILEPALLFGSPFAAYILYLWARQKYPFAVDHWTQSAVSTLVLAGLAVAVAGVLLIGVFAERHHGSYAPAHIENGHLVPGQIQ